MFAILAAICFFLVVIKVGVSIDLIALGLLLLALHFAFGPIIAIPTVRRD